jgi:hypothetical protein
MGGGHRQARHQAGHEPVPAATHAAVLPVKPGTRTRRLDAWDVPREGAAPQGLGLPHAFGSLRPNPPVAPLQAPRFGVIALVGRPHRRPLARTPRLASPQVDRVQPRQDVGAFLPMGRGRAVG